LSKGSQSNRPHRGAKRPSRELTASGSAQSPLALELQAALTEAIRQNGVSDGLQSLIALVDKSLEMNREEARREWTLQIIGQFGSILIALSSIGGAIWLTTTGELDPGKVAVAIAMLLVGIGGPTVAAKLASRTKLPTGP
jgi:hypothetical protein